MKLKNKMLTVKSPWIALHIKVNHETHILSSLKSRKYITLNGIFLKWTFRTYFNFMTLNRESFFSVNGKIMTIKKRLVLDFNQGNIPHLFPTISVLVFL